MANSMDAVISQSVNILKKYRVLIRHLFRDDKKIVFSKYFHDIDMSKKRASCFFIC